MKIRVIQITFGLGCTIFFLVLVLFRVHLGSVGTALANADPMWIGAAMSLRTWRWQIILRPVAAIPYPIVARALLVGYGLTQSCRRDLANSFEPNSSRRPLAFPARDGIKERMNSRWR